MLIRCAGEHDLPALTGIYNHYVTHGHATFDTVAFTVGQRRAWMAQYAAAGPYRLLVGEDEGAVVGYASSSTFRLKPAYRTSVETTIYLHQDHVGRGYGRVLYEALLRQLAQEGIHRAYAGIALPNEASVGLHLSLGFTLAGTYTEVGRKFDRYFDVCWYERKIG